MRLRLLSDLHFEFMRDAGKSFVETLNPDGCDVLVLAGDLSNADGISAALRLICARFAPRPVVYVRGNHESYGSSLNGACVTIRSARHKNRIPNLVWLENGMETILGQRFVGTPLWFREPPNVADKSCMNDYFQIKGFDPQVYQEAGRATSFLQKNLQSTDILVTHYLPSDKCVHAKYAGSPLNAFFVLDIGELLQSRGVKLALPGHTHDSVDVKLGPTRIVCNPFGYVGHELNASFNPSLTIEVP